MNAEDYAAMVAGAGLDTFTGQPSSVGTTTALAGNPNPEIIRANFDMSDATLSIADAIVTGKDFEIDPSGPNLG